MIGIRRFFQQRDTVRLVSSARLKPPVLAPLVDSDDDMTDLAALEMATHGRLRAEATGLAKLHPREMVFGMPNATFVNAAFTYTRPEGNRFNDGSRGAWYCAFAAETSLAEVSFHLTRALADAGNAYDNETVYAELMADFIGRFQDIRRLRPRPDCLHPDTAVGYPAGQTLAREAMAAETMGIVYPSVRHRGGTCLAALHPAVVQNVRQGGLWRLKWDGSPAPTVERLQA